MKTAEELAHYEWLGYVQPVGLVVSVPALLSAQCYINKNIGREQQRLIDHLPKGKDGTPKHEIEDFPLFVREVLQWEQDDLVLFGDQHADLEVALPQYRETLQPTYFVPTDSKNQAENADGKKQIASVLIKEISLGQSFDETLETDSHHHWQASPQSKFERLLRETNVPTGILTNGTHVRLVYAPRGESSGYMTFSIAEMATVAGRPIFAALHTLLCADRLFLVANNQRLPAILSESRKYQNTVSTQLAEQVMSALFELLRGLQAANDQSRGELLRGVLADDPNEVYKGLLTVLMRLVFVLYAEDRGLLSDDPVYVNHYSLTGLFDRLRSDAGRYPDTMEQRYGAWAQLLTLFRMIFSGAKHKTFSIPARSGYLFDPNRYPFLEGSVESDEWSANNQSSVEEVTDGSAELSRFGSVAKGDGSFREMLSSDEAISEGGIVRDDQPDSKGIGLDTSEHSRGASATGNERVSEFLGNSEGFAHGSGNTLDSQPAGRVVTGSRFGQPSNPDRPDQSNVGGTTKVTRKATVTQYAPHSTRPTPQLPRIPDGVIFRVLSNLLILDGERLSYRALDVEQIGSVYETIMGFNIEVSSGKSIAVKPVKSHGAPTTINLERLLEAKAADRVKQLKELTDQALTGQALDKLKSSKSVEDLLGALDRKIAKNVTPNIVPSGAMIFQPSDERRKSGSHYTPRALTEPIVRRTLKPILEQLGENPIPADLLKLKICDPAMGSGAFLVEACRQLADQLVAAWSSHQSRPHIPPDEDEILHARRLVAQRCLYGVDKNPMAVDLAKLSLWLATLAKDHPFTFLDHALRCGDSLVGLTRQQIIGFDLKPKKQLSLFESAFRKKVERATAERRSILEAGDDMLPGMKEHKLKLADEALSVIRLAGDALVASFFSASKPKDRQAKRDQLAESLEAWVRNVDFNARKEVQSAVDELRSGEHAIEPFHWEAEFSEVFTFDARGKATGGFDCIVGNPPFQGGRNLSAASGETYVDWIMATIPDSVGASDLVAHFFRSSFNHLCTQGSFGLIATNTVSQGDTRRSGLRFICENGGTIYNAQTRVRWPGEAAVIVSTINIFKGPYLKACFLNGTHVSRINAYLFQKGGNEEPEKLRSNARLSFQGSITYGMGFTFDDNDRKGVASPTSMMDELLQKDKSNSDRIFPYLGGDELNTQPDHQHSRFVIFFGDMTLEQASRWPDLLKILELRVKPDRESKTSDVANWPWWQFWRSRNELYERIKNLDRVLLTNAQATPHHCFAFSTSKMVFANSLNVFPFQTCDYFALLQSRVHEVWARSLSSSLKDDLRYNPTDCFETFPMPDCLTTQNTQPIQSTTSLASVGDVYYDFRAKLMLTNNEGLTKTYNRFHDPDEQSPKIIKLRELHADMDRAVLEAYGWNDLAATANCEFLLDYEDEEEDQETSRRKKPWRYRWPDDFRDEVLARLLELNAQRAKEESLTGAQTRQSRTRTKITKPSSPTLPGME